MWRPYVVVLCAVLATGCGSSGSSSGTSGTEHFDRASWQRLASDPDAYKGATVDFVGRVFTAPQRDSKGVYLQVWADPQASELATIVAYAKPSFQVQEDDYVRVHGTVKGAYKGKNMLGREVIDPTVVATRLTVVDALAAAPRALATLPSRTQTTSGITVTVRRVEFAPAETRVLLAVRNQSGAQVSVYSFSMKAVQSGVQVDQKSSFDYPELSSDVVAGASTTGVVVFPKLRPKAGLKLYVEVHSTNSQVGKYGTLTFTFLW